MFTFPPLKNNPPRKAKEKKNNLSLKGLYNKWYL